jgi:molybdopterin molybdotransferase
MTETILSFEQALEMVLSHARGLGLPPVAETVGIGEAVGRTLAGVVVADRDQPPFDRSTRDGYALLASDAAGSLRVVGEVRAGKQWDGAALAEAEALEIMTGAPLPDGADAVVMVEHVLLDGKRLRVEAGRSLRVGENVVARGAEARAGEVLLPVGRLLGAAEIAVAASCGRARVEVFARPKVAIVATGDELVELDEALEPWQIRNSNSYALAGLVGQEGGVAGRLKVARDTRSDLLERVAQGSMWDLMLLSGGVSAGKYDLVEEVLAAFGAEFFFTGAMIQPGKPIVFGRIPKRGIVPQNQAGKYSLRDRTPWDGEWTYFFGLPGNPVSTQVCFHLFVAPMLRALGGRTEIAPRFVEARLAEAVKGGARVTRFLPAELRGGWDGVSVRVVGWQGSGDVAANARGDCYAVLPMGVEAFAVGATVRVLLR